MQCVEDMLIISVLPRCNLLLRLDKVLSFTVLSSYAADQAASTTLQFQLACYAEYSFCLLLQYIMHA
jgi:hypothetical protein